MSVALATKRERAAAPPLTVTRPDLLVAGSDHLFRQLVHDLFAFMGRHEAIRAGFAAQIGLAGVEYTVLISIAHLGAAEGSVGLTRVAEHLHLSGTFITTLTNKLARLGLIEKRPDPADRRRVRLVLCKEAYRRLAQLAPTQQQVNDAEFQPLGHEEFHDLVRLVGALVASSDQALQLQACLAGHCGAADAARG